MKKQEVFGVSLFLIGCFAFGYFAVQKSGIFLPLTLGSAMIIVGAIAQVQQKTPTRRKIKRV